MAYVSEDNLKICEENGVTLFAKTNSAEAAAAASALDEGFSFRLHVKEGGHYTFWDYRRPKLFERNLGWRVDHIWATGPMAARSRRAWIDTKPRGDVKPSDHTFIAAEFAW